MTLKEVSVGYRDAAEKVRKQLYRLRRMRRDTTDPGERWRIDYQISHLTPVLTELNELAELTEHYYDRGYYRDQKYIV